MENIETKFKKEEEKLGLLKIQLKSIVSIILTDQTVQMLKSRKHLK